MGSRWLLASYKRLETGTFRIELPSDEMRVPITRTQFAMLLEGIDLKKRKIRKPYEPGIRIHGRRGQADRQARVAK